MLEHLKEQLKALQSTLKKPNHCHLDPADLLAAYRWRVINAVAAILAENTTLPEIANRFAAFLSENWALVNGTLLCYTALPKDSVTLFLCKIAEFVAVHTQRPAITILMPTVTLYDPQDNQLPNVNTYPPLQDKPLPWVLCNYLLGTEGYQLLPIKLLLKVYLAEGKHDAVLNPYWNSEAIENYQRDGLLTPSQVHRMTIHSAETRALIETWETYQAMLEQRNSLYDQLLMLTRRLLANSAHGGIGIQQDAAAGAYPAIISFQEYYRALTEDAITQIPSALNNEIMLLLELASNPESNINSTENMETCIGTRGEKISPLLTQHQTRLKTIGISDENHLSLLHHASENFSNTQHELTHSVETEHYAGVDNGLSLSLRLLHTLEVNTTRLNHPKALRGLLSFSLPCLEALLAEPGLATLPAQIVRAIGRLETAVLICHHEPTEKLKPFLSAIGETLFQRGMISTPGQLASFLTSLIPEKIACVCESLNVQLPKILRAGQDLGAVLIALNEAQCSALLTACRALLPLIIQSGDALRSLLMYLNKAQCTAVTAILPFIFESAAEFNCVMKPLTESSRSLVFEAYQEQLKNLIKSKRDLDQMASYLQYAEKQALFTSFAQLITGPLRKIHAAVCVNDTRAFFLFDFTTFNFNQHKQRPHELIKHFFQHLNHYPKGSLARAWHIHCKRSITAQVNTDNPVLLNAIYADIHTQHSTGFFKSARIRGNDSEIQPLSPALCAKIRTILR